MFSQEKKHLIDELELSKSQYAERDNDVLRVQELLERLQMEKAKLSRRVSKLVHNGNTVPQSVDSHDDRALQRRNSCKNYNDAVGQRSQPRQLLQAVHRRENFPFPTDWISI